MLLALLNNPGEAAPKETLVPLQRHASLKGQEDLQPNSLIFSPNGKFLASLEGRDGIIRLWDAATGKSAGTLRHRRAVYHVAFSPDGKRIVTCGDNKIRLWDVVSRKNLTLIHTGWPIFAVRFTADGKRLTAIEKDWLVTWDIEKKEEVSSRKLTAQPDFLSAWPAMKKPAFFLRPEDGNTFALVDLLSGDTVWSAKGHKRPIIGFALSRDEKTIASVDSLAVRLWDRDTGKHLATIEHLSDVIYSPLLRANGRNYACALSPDGKFLACAYEYQVPRGRRGGGFRLYAIPSGKLLAEVPEEIGITSLVFSPDGRLLATEFRTGIELWTIPTDEKKKDK
jgi:WD40 repeat protein